MASDPTTNPNGTSNLNTENINTIIKLMETFKTQYESSGVQDLLQDYCKSIANSNTLVDSVSLFRELYTSTLTDPVPPAEVTLNVFTPTNIPDKSVTSEYYDKINFQLSATKFDTTDFNTAIINMCKMILILGRTGMIVNGNIAPMKDKFGYISSSLIHSFLDMGVVNRPKPNTAVFHDAKNLVALISGLIKITKTSPTVFKKPDTMAPINEFLATKAIAEPDAGINVIIAVLKNTSPVYEATKLLEFFKFPKETQIQSQAAVISVVLYTLQDMIRKSVHDSPPDSITVVDTIKLFLNVKEPVLILNVVTDQQKKADIVSELKDALSVNNYSKNVNTFPELVEEIKNLKELAGMGIFVNNKNTQIFRDPMFYNEIFDADKKSFFGAAPEDPVEPASSAVVVNKKTLPRRKPTRAPTLIEKTEWPSQAKHVTEVGWQNKLYNTIAEILIELPGQNLYSPLTSQTINELIFLNFYTGISGINMFVKIIALSMPNLLELCTAIVEEIGPQVYKSLGHAYLEKYIKTNGDKLTPYGTIAPGESLDEKILNKHQIWPYNYSYRVAALLYPNYIPSRVLQMPLHVVGNFPAYQLVAQLVFYGLGHEREYKDQDSAECMGHSIYMQMLMASGVVPNTQTGAYNTDYMEMGSLEILPHFCFSRILDIMLESAESTLFEDVSSRGIDISHAGNGISLMCENYGQYFEVAPVQFAIAHTMGMAFTAQSSYRPFDPNSTGIVSSLGLHLMQMDFLKNTRQNAAEPDRIASHANGATCYVNQFRIIYEFFIKRLAPRRVFNHIVEDTEQINYMSNENLESFKKRLAEKMKLDENTNEMQAFGLNGKNITIKDAPIIDRDFVDTLLSTIKKEEGSIYSLFLTKPFNYIYKGLCDQQKKNNFEPNEVVKFVMIKIDKSVIPTKFIQLLNEFSIPTNIDSGKFEDFLMKPARKIPNVENSNYISSNERTCCKPNEILISISINLMTIIHNLPDNTLTALIAQKSETAAKMFSFLKTEVLSKYNGALKRKILDIKSIFELLFAYHKSSATPTINPQSTYNNILIELTNKKIFKPTAEFISIILDSVYDLYLASNIVMSETSFNREGTVYCLDEDCEFNTVYLYNSTNIIIGGPQRDQQYWAKCKRYYMYQQKCIFESMCSRLVLPVTKVHTQCSFFEMVAIGPETAGLEPGYLFRKCNCTSHCSACLNLNALFNNSRKTKLDYLKNLQISSGDYEDPYLLVPSWVLYMIQNFDTTFFYTVASQSMFIRLCYLFSQIKIIIRRNSNPYSGQINKDYIMQNFLTMVINSDESALNLSPSIPFLKIQSTFTNELLKGLYINEGQKIDLFGGVVTKKRKADNEGLFLTSSKKTDFNRDVSSTMSTSGAVAINKNNEKILDDLDSKLRSEVINAKTDSKINWQRWIDLEPPIFSQTDIKAIDIGRSIEALNSKIQGIDTSIESNNDTNIDIIIKLLADVTTDPNLKTIASEYDQIKEQNKASTKSSPMSMDFKISSAIRFFENLTKRCLFQIHYLTNKLHEANLYMYKGLNIIAAEVEILLIENYFCQQFIKNPQLFLHIPQVFTEAAWEVRTVEGGVNIISFVCVPSLPEFSAIAKPGDLPEVWREKLKMLLDLKKNNITFVDLNAAMLLRILLFVRKYNTSPKKERLVDLLIEMELSGVVLKDFQIPDHVKFSRKKPVFFLGIFLYGIVLDACGVKFE